MFPIEKLKDLRTPFYFYDTELLNRTLQAALSEAVACGYHLHYAVKANANPRILAMIQAAGFGADCVSGGEIQAALDAGFSADKVVFAGVGKADWEINLGLDNNIFCFNVESIPELQVIDELAAAKAQTARVALRINPEVDAHTHAHITTGKKENKFGINLDLLDAVLDTLAGLKHVQLIGLHFHIGSQLLDLEPFQMLCDRAKTLQESLLKRGIRVEHLNFGGGLGIDYEQPDAHPIPDFKAYFKTFHDYFPVAPGQQVHFEPGRSIVGQCGTLISKVLYVKEGSEKKFVVLDAGFTELLRPALYEASHLIENLTAPANEKVTYDVVGPICESSDCFAKDIKLPKTQRGDWVALRSAGAYGEIMASQYNCRQLPKSYFLDLL
ncbi:diaminopimelate decarboxylase [Bacteroidia bacterium]|nr:diaminopimelate decarboxylase [Bacteroidia bacterium]